jgi:hypothetical protein
MELGIPEWLATLGDTLFRRLRYSEAEVLRAAFLEAIPVGCQRALKAGQRRALENQPF